MERETAMKILKELHDNSLFSNRIALETLIPELADSNDERIRKALLEMVHDTTGDELWVDYNVHKEEALAWLEKQGQTFTKKDVDDAYLKGICDAKHELEKQGEQKPAVTDFNAKDWYVSKVDGKIHNIYHSVDKIEQKPISDTTYVVKAGDSLSVVNGKPFDYEHATITQKDFAPKPTEWSDEDENYLQSAENACEYQYGKNTSTILWLKSLKDRVQGKEKKK